MREYSARVLTPTVARMLGSPRFLVPGWAAAILAAAILFYPGMLRAQPGAFDPEVVEALCSACHSDKFAALPANPHGVLATESWIERTGQQPACVNCHVDVSTHISGGGGLGNVFAFREESPIEIRQVCLGCHDTTHPEFEQSPHALAGISCADCHSQHGSVPMADALLREPAVTGRLDRAGTESRICMDCHEDIAAQFALNERHPLLQGTLECTSCHDPHAPVTRNQLGGFKQALCVDCHTDKEGPFVFEHASSRIGGCTACHSPHGSPNRHMLNNQRVAELCVSCHASVPQFHLRLNPEGRPRFNLDTQCTNCHSSIHGSNFHPRFLR